MIARIFKFERARGRACSAISAPPRLSPPCRRREWGSRPTSELSRRSARTERNGVSRAGWSVTRVWCVHARTTDAIQPTCEEGVCDRSVCCHDVRVSRGQRRLGTSQPCPSLRNMARDSRRVVVAVVGGGNGGSVTVRCKLVLVFLVLLLAIVVPAAYADSQGESCREFLIKRYVRVINVRGCH